MLYPQNNRCRALLELDGLWQGRTDPDDRGASAGWFRGFDPAYDIAVPGSWNEQLAEAGLMFYTGAFWYRRSFFVPAGLACERFILRFGSADFTARVWLNGVAVGGHAGGFLPFEFDVTDTLRRAGENLLVVCVDNRLSHQTIPQGLTAADYADFQRKGEETYPPAAFDFLAYGGLHRPVRLLGLPARRIEAVRLRTTIDGSRGRIAFDCELTGQETLAPGESLRWTLYPAAEDSPGDEAALRPLVQATGLTGELTIDACRFWGPDDPYLYRLVCELWRADEEAAGAAGESRLVDEYRLDVGLREVRIDGDRLLLNGRPIFLKGFGRHEDFHVLGKGLSPALQVKDFELLRWIGANSFRTSHYPYAEEIMQLADRRGVLVIDECPAVSLNMKLADETTLANHRRCLSELIARDRNHACVIAWSIANEPGIWMEQEARGDWARSYWRELRAHVRGLDPDRPVTMPGFFGYPDDPVFEFSDLIAVNRYWGWYELPARLERAGAHFEAEMRQIHARYGKPILLSEFGVDTVEGLHATYPQFFTEEFQTEFLKTYFEVIDRLDFMVGEHIWAFADFRTPQHWRRVVYNRKGIFTREREPKSAAFAVRERWLGKADFPWSRS